MRQRAPLDDPTPSHYVDAPLGPAHAGKRAGATCASTEKNKAERVSAEQDMSRSPNQDSGENPKDDSRRDTTVQGMYRLVGIGFEFACTVGVMALLGWYLDRRWNTTPRYLLVGLAVGFAAGLYLLIQSARSSFKD